MNDRFLYLRPGMPTPPPLMRYDRGGERYYATVGDDGSVTWYPSVTSVIRATSPTPPGLMAWYAKHGMDGADKLRDEAAERGTLMHTLFARYLMGQAVMLDVLDEFQQKALASFDAWCQDYAVEPLAVEVLMHSRRGYAGTADLVCRINDGTGQQVVLVDFKSGANLYRDHAVQLVMYAEAWREWAEATGAPVVEAVYNWAPKDWRKSPTYTFKDRTGEVSLEEIDMRCKLYTETNDRAPRGRTVITGTLPGAMQIRNEDPAAHVREKWARMMGDEAPATAGVQEAVTPYPGDNRLPLGVHEAVTTHHLPLPAYFVSPTPVSP